MAAEGARFGFTVVTVATAGALRAPMGTSIVR